MLRILGLETSCDETAAAVVTDARDILSNVVLSQLDDHRPYGGVVPEIAARSHLDHLDTLIREALEKADCDIGSLDAIAATGGPGLIGGVMVGVLTAKAMALAAGKPFIAVNHLEGHALTVRLTHDVPFPYLLLLVSGGHCQLLSVTGVGEYTRYGSTLDDAVGEAFDKTAKMLGLGYPGGPAVEAAAATGDPARFALPRPMAGRPGCDFSFSGLKTRVRQVAETLPCDAQGRLDAQDCRDLAAGFQTAVSETLAARTANALDRFEMEYARKGPLVVAGGVAANTAIRAQLEKTCAERGTELIAPPIPLCTDNAAMIAWAGLERFRLGARDSLDFKPRPRWPLDSLSADGTEAKS